MEIPGVPVPELEHGDLPKLGDVSTASWHVTDSQALVWQLLNPLTGRTLHKLLQC